MSRERFMTNPIFAGTKPAFHVDIQTAFQSHPDNWIPARLLELSESGVYLVTSRPPCVGERVRLRGESSPSSSGTVDSIARLSKAEWGFHVRFDGVNQSPEVESILENQLEGMKPEAFDYYSRLRRVRDYVLKHYTEDIPLETAAQIAALEKTYFSTFFHSKVGIRYHDWLQSIRIQNAIFLMEKRDYSITEVANAVGFNDLRTFQRVFRKWTQMTPRDFRKLVCR